MLDILVVFSSTDLNFAFYSLLWYVTVYRRDVETSTFVDENRVVSCINLLRRDLYLCSVDAELSFCFKNIWFMPRKKHALIKSW